MTEHLSRASEYLALAESKLDGSPSDNLFLAIAHSLVGALAHLSGQQLEVVEASTEPAPADDGFAVSHTCVLCGRQGSRQFEDSPVGPVCTHVVKCAERRHTESEDTQ